MTFLNSKIALELYRFGLAAASGVPGGIAIRQIENGNYMKALLCLAAFGIVLGAAFLIPRKT